MVKLELSVKVEGLEWIRMADQILMVRGDKSLAKLVGNEKVEISIYSAIPWLCCLQQGFS